MRSHYLFAMLTLAAVSACGGSGHDAAPSPPAPSITLAATATSVMRQGSSILIRPTFTGVTGPVTWTLAPTDGGQLTDFPNNLVATYTATDATTTDKVTITATAGGVSQSIQIGVRPAPPLLTWVDLPALWTKAPTNVGDRISGGGPVASAADKAGNLYLAYAAPVSEIKKVAADGTISTYARMGNPGSLAFGPDGALYVVDTVASFTFAIRRIAADGTVSTLTQTAPFEIGKGTIDGPSGVATANNLTIAVSPTGVLYATDRSRIRKMAADGSLSTLAGGGCETYGGPGPTCGPSVDGHGADARFTETSGIVLDAAGNLYVSDGGKIRKVTPSGDVSTLAGSGADTDSYSTSIDGTGSAARFEGSGPLAIDPAGNLYKLSGSGGPLRKITPAGVVSTVAADTRLMFWAVDSQNTIVSLYAGTPGVVVLQTSAALIKVNVDG